ncbi:protein of unknown function [Nitrosomonas sp. Nm51]|uniref:DUF2442 domain-containing protein n=1 Tax=Nitrosomonas sp. Nm51 TaxID=133720 RepID=UPI0008BF6242|nr:DUF2442 domain-containing protein [Nitrosomonas sp. Nm51]SER23084.1 protein of unknown function [Nitrosomonas sp. Nm51]
MPTVLRIGLYRFHFYSHEPNEPPHIHIDRDNSSAKFWLENPALARNLGFSAKELNKLHKLVQENQQHLLGHGMGILALSADERVKDVRFTDELLSVDLADGRTISVPILWYPRLLNATPQQRSNWEICGAGYGIHWPEIDEDLSTEGLLRGSPAPAIQRRSSYKGLKTDNFKACFNATYWLPKLQRNTERDVRHQRELNELGWGVLVLWECETQKPDAIAEKIKSFLS